MFDLEVLKKNRPLVEEMLRKRGQEAPLDEILLLEENRVQLVRSINSLREQRNSISSQVKTCRDQDCRERLIESSREIRAQVLDAESRLAEVSARIRDLVMWLPNMLAPDVPYGEDESGNVEVRRHGVPQSHGFPRQRPR
ncbi:MAG: hypothetical protein ACOX3V_04350 [Bacillota bacterium]